MNLEIGPPTVEFVYEVAQTEPEGQVTLFPVQFAESIHSKHEME